MDNLLSLLLGFIGTLLALVVTKTIEYSLQRRLAAAELARDALVDFASTTTNLEGTVECLRNEPRLSTPVDLVEVPSEYRREPPTIPIDRMLAGFSDERLHRTLMLFFNRHKLFVERSNERKTAFYWLLDNPDIAWTEPRALERVETIRRSTDDLTRYSLEMLRLAFEAMDRFYEIAERGVSLIRTDFSDTKAFLESTYRLTKETIALRRAYHSSEYLPGRTGILPPFNPRIDYEVFRWDDSTAVELARHNGRLVVELFVPGTEPLRLGLRPFVEVAMPRGASIRSAHLNYWRADGSFEERDIPLEILPNGPHATSEVRIDVVVAQPLVRTLHDEARADAARRARRRGT